MRTQFGPYIVDTDTRQLLRREADVHISPKGFDLLATLLSRRPAVVSKQELFQLIWPDTFVAEASLNVLVAEVRRAIGDAPRAPRFIRTVHGVGYAFSGEASDVESRTVAPARGGASAAYWLEGKDRTHGLDAGEHIVGRDPACDIWLNDPSVSRRHARIRIASGSPPTLEDLGSTNGTFLGRHRIDGSTALADGNRITFGSVELAFRAAADRLEPTRRVRRR